MFAAAKLPLTRVALARSTPAVATRAFAASAQPAAAEVAENSSANAVTLDDFVSKAMHEMGLGEFSKDTLQALKNAQVINLNLLYKLSDSDFKAAGVSVGASRALKEAIMTRKRSEVVARTGERAELRRALSKKMKEAL
mmetsp:Transcript_1261/g.3097  ORF Transcript_1261/g.3097 Transcript_1261/m.3097 type:complete len:139 (-) Transcript_1261:314-730(-)|eukprot:CAMPEP_0171498090 /NCGR_PEP_ID=MMETSP0958-20121227/7648_1 /TAXON_ID=87120 /ORGANISM="Aurantiochytrium limacinum, Strain ATCCMYA-1381" /LENGTH=138 /DNA_ID=CAMNT_0012032433 /DNA_START=101 /DNA_END=517 /DNA_ORIENTATION=-